MLRRLLLFTALVVGWGAFGSVANAAVPSLAGENLVSSTGLAGTGDHTAECNPAGTNRITFFATGVATGPYPGTFTESGVIEFTTSPGVLPVVTRFEAEFTIMSVVGTVTGTKTLNPAVFPTDTFRSGALCSSSFLGRHTDSLFGVVFDYTARITSPTGVFQGQDSGSGNVYSREQNFFGGLRGFVFDEMFLVSNGVIPAQTPGKATGGGQVGDVVFGFEVFSGEDESLRARCTVIDQASNTMIRCLDAVEYVQVGTNAYWSGTAEVNGVRTRYRIDVDDIDESGIGRDTFTIHTDTGYVAGGILTSGNIQLHKQPA